MKLKKLQILHTDMREKKDTFTSFEYQNGKCDFDVYFDISKTPYQLIFFLKFDKISICFDVKQGYNINTNLDKPTYSQLVEALGIKFNPENKFSTSKFFKDFNDKIPLESSKSSEDVKKRYYQYLNVNTDTEDAEKIYYCGNINHNKNKDGKNQSPENLKKTRILYPKLYQICIKEGNNISIKYTKNKSKEKTNPKRDFEDYT